MKAKVTVKSGKSSGTKLVSAEVRVVKTGGKPRITGKPIYQTKAQLNLHIGNGARPTKTQFRRTG